MVLYFLGVGLLIVSFDFQLESLWCRWLKGTVAACLKFALSDVLLLVCYRCENVLNSEINSLALGQILIIELFGSCICPFDWIAPNLESTFTLCLIHFIFLLWRNLQVRASTRPAPGAFQNGVAPSLKSVQISSVVYLSVVLRDSRIYPLSVSPSGASDRKSARTWPFMAFLGMNEILYVPISTAYLANFPEREPAFPEGNNSSLPRLAFLIHTATDIVFRYRSVISDAETALLCDCYGICIECLFRKGGVNDEGIYSTSSSAEMLLLGLLKSIGFIGNVCQGSFSILLLITLSSTLCTPSRYSAEANSLSGHAQSSNFKIEYIPHDLQHFLRELGQTVPQRMRHPGCVFRVSLVGSCNPKKVFLPMVIYLISGCGDLNLLLAQLGPARRAVLSHASGCFYRKFGVFSRSLACLRSIVVLSQQDVAIALGSGDSW
ncbi:hypothetical protein Tco_0039079 [Tanacetum coccineum]